MQVPVRELKADLSRLLARAQAGEVIEVTSHNRPVARILGAPKWADGGVGRLLALGQLSWGGGKPAFEAPLRLGGEGMAVSRMVLEDRG